MAIQELHDASETLFSIHADADFFPVLIPHYSKDDRRNVEVVIERIDDFHLLSCRPDNIFPFLLAKIMANKYQLDRTSLVRRVQIDFTIMNLDCTARYRLTESALTGESFKTDGLLWSSSVVYTLALGCSRALRMLKMFGSIFSSAMTDSTSNSSRSSTDSCFSMELRAGGGLH